MSRERVHMRKVRELLRLRWEAKLSWREIARSVNLSASAVRACIARAEEAGLTWPLDAGLDDSKLEGLLYKISLPEQSSSLPLLDFSWLHTELRKPHVTLALLWQEYLEKHPDGLKYSRFCDLYREWSKKLTVTMRQHHVAGEKCFLDFAGDTVPIYCEETGKVRFRAQVFVAVLGASSYTFAYAVENQGIESWILANCLALEFFGGVPLVLVPDNLKAGVKDPNFYDPVINVTFAEMAKYYSAVVIPARVRKPKDKAKVEAGVLVSERWILAAVRNEKFYFVEALNVRIRELLEKLNNRRTRYLNASRRELFEKLDKPALTPLPTERFEMAQWKRSKVNIDYHIEVEKRYYSVPYSLARQEVEVRATAHTVEVFCKGVRVASHRRSLKLGEYKTLPEHMPKEHRAFRDWTPERIRNWAASIGKNVGELAEEILTKPDHPEQGFRACLGLIRLADKYPHGRIDAACKRSLATRIATYRDVKQILKLGLDSKPLDPRVTNVQPPLMLDHENIRGPSYYKQK